MASESIIYSCFMPQIGDRFHCSSLSVNVCQIIIGSTVFKHLNFSFTLLSGKMFPSERHFQPPGWQTLIIGLLTIYANAHEQNTTSFSPPS